MELAIQDDGVLVNNVANTAYRTLGAAYDLGARWIRVNLFSSYVKAYGWEMYDTAIERMVTQGFKVQLTISGQPRYHLQGDPGGVPFSDPTPEQFAAWVRTCVTRYRPHCDRFALWNEPNHPAYLEVTTGDTAAHYGRLYRAGYAEVRALAPTARILFGEISGSIGALSFIRRAIAGSRTFASGLAIHPYQFATQPDRPVNSDSLEFGNLPKLIAATPEWAVTKELRTLAGERVPIYITEFGYSASKRPDLRAAWTALALSLARQWGIRQFLYYHLTDAPDAGWNTGILSREGTPSPTFNVIRAMAPTL